MSLTLLTNFGVLIEFALAQTEALGLAKALLQLAGVGPESLHQLLLPGATTECSSSCSLTGAGLQLRDNCISAGYGL